MFEARHEEGLRPSALAQVTVRGEPPGGDTLLCGDSFNKACPRELADLIPEAAEAPALIDAHGGDREGCIDLPFHLRGGDQEEGGV